MNWMHATRQVWVRIRGWSAAGAAALLLCIAALGLTGCGNFFNPSSTSSSSSGGSGGSTSSSTLDVAYIANSNLDLENVAPFSIGTAGKLTALSATGSLGAAPLSIAINPAGTLLWVATYSGVIYVYVVESNGTLELGNSSTPVQETFANSMVVDPTGQWMLVSSDTGGTTAPLISVYAINQTNGELTQQGQAIALDSGSADQVVFAPNGTNVFAALGTGGVDSLLFTPSTGALSKLNVLLEPSLSDDADQALAIDPKSKYLYVAETGINAVRALTINSNGSLTTISGSPFATGLGPISLLMDSTGSYLYSANSTDGTISAFQVGTTGALSELSGSPFATGSEPYSLAEDSSHSYVLVACVGGSPDMQEFSIASTSTATPGALTSVQTATTGSDSPAGAISVVATP